MTETVPPGWLATLPAAVDVTVTFNTTVDVTFGNRRVRQLAASLKYEDANGNGQQDAGRGSGGGHRRDDPASWGHEESKLTGADGYASWTDLPIGTYRVTETVPPGWLATLPAAVDVTVIFNTTVDVTFGNRRVGNLRVLKYEDANGNGQRDAGEGPVAGVTVTIRHPGGTEESKLTGADGYASWTDLPIGTYRVTETVPPGWLATLPAAVDVTVNFNTTVDVTFGNRRVGNLRVLKYEDANGNGQRDAGEGPVAGVTVTIRYPGGAEESKVTGADGYASWTDLPIGSVSGDGDGAAGLAGDLARRGRCHGHLQHHRGRDLRQPARGQLARLRLRGRQRERPAGCGGGSGSGHRCDDPVPERHDRGAATPMAPAISSGTRSLLVPIRQH